MIGYSVKSVSDVYDFLVRRVLVTSPQVVVSNLIIILIGVNKIIQISYA